MQTCNQCNRFIKNDSEIGLAFNMGYGPVYVCITCKPPAKSNEIISDINDFIKGIDESSKNNDT